MALPKNRRRKIVVHQQTYYWIVNANDGWFDIVIQAESGEGQKIIAQFGFETKNEAGEMYSKHFEMSSYLVRETILYGLRNGFEPEVKKKDMKLFDIWRELDLDIPGKRKTVKLVEKVENRLLTPTSGLSAEEREEVRSFFKETREFLQYNEWFLGFETLLDGLYENEWRLDKGEWTLVKEILRSKNILAKDDWAWVNELQKGEPKRDESFPKEH
ncbi:MAG: MafI family immunity protein [Bacteroidota bacterium]